MFVEHQPKWRPILYCGTIVSLCSLSGILLADGVAPSEIWHSFTRFGLVSLMVWLTWLLFTKWAWRWSCFRWNGWLVSTPDLNGRWIGTYISSYDEKERPMALEIRQTFLKLQCTAFAPGSEGNSFIARLLSDADEHSFKLINLYHTKRYGRTEHPGDEHQGVAILRVINGSSRRLDGYYFNDRTPKPLKGEINLRWESAKLIDQLYPVPRMSAEKEFTPE